jgi:hypothetical protein
VLECGESHVSGFEEEDDLFAIKLGRTLPVVGEVLPMTWKTGVYHL